MDVGWALPVLWVGLGGAVVVSSVRASRSRRSYVVGITTVSALWLAAGAGANAYFLVRGEDYSGFADAASTSFVRETWDSLVVPHHTTFIGLLIAFEAAAGVLVLVAGGIRQATLLVLIAFNIALVSFGWGFLIWSAPLVLGLFLLWREGRSRRGVDDPAPVPGRRPGDRVRNVSERPGIGQSPAIGRLRARAHEPTGPMDADAR